MNNPLITVDSLTRNYGDYTAVNDISFHIYPGEVYGLLGTNGAGKTSTLEIMEGLAAPSSGTVRINGLDPIADRSELRPELGIMLQDGGLPQALTVDETLKMWAGLCSTPRSVDHVLESMSLTHRRKVKVGSLSGGEQRRVDLACALLGQPSVLFLDEPTTGLDPESRRSVWALLGELKASGVTMILTTHYLEEAEVLCDRIAIMNKGIIEVEGTLDGLTSQVPSHITFTPPAEQLDDLPEMRGASITREAGAIKIATNDLQNDALTVLNWAQQRGAHLENFSARPASLEQVFLDIAGTQAPSN